VLLKENEMGEEKKKFVSEERNVNGVVENKKTEEIIQMKARALETL